MIDFTGKSNADAENIHFSCQEIDEEKKTSENKENAPQEKSSHSRSQKIRSNTQILTASKPLFSFSLKWNRLPNVCFFHAANSLIVMHWPQSLVPVLVIGTTSLYKGSIQWQSSQSLASSISINYQPKHKQSNHHQVSHKALVYIIKPSLTITKANPVI